MAGRHHLESGDSGAHHARIRTKFAYPDGHLRRAGKRLSAQGRDQRVNEEPSELSYASGQDYHFRVNHVAESAERAAEHSSCMIDHADRGLVPVRTCPGDLLKAARSPGTGQGRIPSGDTWTGGNCLAMTGTAARTRQRILAAAHVDRDVPNLARAAGSPAP